MAGLDLLGQLAVAVRLPRPRGPVPRGNRGGRGLPGARLGATDWATHERLATEEADRAAAWLLALEAEVVQPGGHWELSPDATGGWGGQESQPDFESDDGPVRGWFSRDSEDETFSIDRDQPVVAPIPDRGHDPALITPQEQADETMATQEIKDLLLEAGPFARLGATEQRTRLVTYYQSWFLSDYRIDTVNNIRASQRLTTHAKLMALPVGVVLQAILLEASGIEPSSHGLLDVEPSPIVGSQEDRIQRDQQRPGDNPVGPTVHREENRPVEDASLSIGTVSNRVAEQDVRTDILVSPILGGRPRFSLSNSAGRHGFAAPTLLTWRLEPD